MFHICYLQGFIIVFLNLNFITHFYLFNLNFLQSIYSLIISIPRIAINFLFQDPEA